MTVSASTQASRAGQTSAASVSATSRAAASMPLTIWPTGPRSGSTGSTSVTSAFARAAATVPSGSKEQTTTGVAPPAHATSASRRAPGVPSASASADAGLAARMTAATVMGSLLPRPGVYPRRREPFRPSAGYCRVTPAARRLARSPLPTSLGLWSTVLRRSRADWPVVLASWALLASALSLLAAGTLYTDAVTIAGLHRELSTAPAADRAIVVRTQILPDRLATADAAVAPELRRAVAPTGGELAHVLQSSPFADAAADPETVTDLVLFASFEGIERHATLVDGRWPDARAGRPSR